MEENKNDKSNTKKMGNAENNKEQEQNNCELKCEQTFCSKLSGKNTSLKLEGKNCFPVNSDEIKSACLKCRKEGRNVDYVFYCPECDEYWIVLIEETDVEGAEGDKSITIKKKKADLMNKDDSMFNVTKSQEGEKREKIVALEAETTGNSFGNTVTDSSSSYTDTTSTLSSSNYTSRLYSSSSRSFQEGEKLKLIPTDSAASFNSASSLTIEDIKKFTEDNKREKSVKSKGSSISRYTGLISMGIHDFTKSKKNQVFDEISQETFESKDQTRTIASNSTLVVINERKDISPTQIEKIVPDTLTAGKSFSRDQNKTVITGDEKSFIDDSPKSKKLTSDQKEEVDKSEKVLEKKMSDVSINSDRSSDSKKTEKSNKSVKFDQSRTVTKLTVKHSESSDNLTRSEQEFQKRKHLIIDDLKKLVEAEEKSYFNKHPQIQSENEQIVESSQKDNTKLDSVKKDATNDSKKSSIIELKTKNNTTNIINTGSIESKKKLRNENQEVVHSFEGPSFFVKENVSTLKMSSLDDEHDSSTTQSISKAKISESSIENPRSTFDEVLRTKSENIPRKTEFTVSTTKETWKEPDLEESGIVPAETLKNISIEQKNSETEQKYVSSEGKLNSRESSSKVDEENQLDDNAATEKSTLTGRITTHFPMMDESRLFKSNNFFDEEGLFSDDEFKSTIPSDQASFIQVLQSQVDSNRIISDSLEDETPPDQIKSVHEKGMSESVETFSFFDDDEPLLEKSNIAENESSVEANSKKRTKEQVLTAFSSLFTSQSTKKSEIAQSSQDLENKNEPNETISSKSSTSEIDRTKEKSSELVSNHTSSLPEKTSKSTIGGEKLENDLDISQKSTVSSEKSVINSSEENVTHTKPNESQLEKEPEQTVTSSQDKILASISSKTGSTKSKDIKEKSSSDQNISSTEIETGETHRRSTYDTQDTKLVTENEHLDEKTAEIISIILSRLPSQMISEHSDEENDQSRTRSRKSGNLSDSVPTKKSKKEDTHVQENALNERIDTKTSLEKSRSEKIVDEIEPEIEEIEKSDFSAKKSTEDKSIEPNFPKHESSVKDVKNSAFLTTDPTIALNSKIFDEQKDNITNEEDKEIEKSNEPARVQDSYPEILKKLEQKKKEQQSQENITGKKSSSIVSNTKSGKEFVSEVPPENSNPEQSLVDEKTEVKSIVPIKSLSESIKSLDKNESIRIEEKKGIKSGSESKLKEDISDIHSEEKISEEQPVLQERDQNTLSSKEVKRRTYSEGSDSFSFKTEEESKRMKHQSILTQKYPKKDKSITTHENSDAKKTDYDETGLDNIENKTLSTQKTAKDEEEKKSDDGKKELKSKNLVKEVETATQELKDLQIEEPQSQELKIKSSAEPKKSFNEVETENPDEIEKIDDVKESKLEVISETDKSRSNESNEEDFISSLSDSTSSIVPGLYSHANDEIIPKFDLKKSHRINKNKKRKRREMVRLLSRMTSSDSLSEKTPRVEGKGRVNQLIKYFEHVIQKYNKED